MESQFVLAAGFYVVFVLSTVLHEAAHAWAALRLGDDTAQRAGQVSLDPIPHITREPIGMVLLPILTLAFIGWPLGFASAPYDPIWADRYPRRAGWMALAGPAANLLLFLLAAAGLRWGLAAGLFQAPEALSVYSVAETARLTPSGAPSPSSSASSSSRTCCCCSSTSSPSRRSTAAPPCRPRAPLDGPSPRSTRG